MDENKYLIIGGSTKCGTTSVFNYFEFHPMICSCVRKESRFFLESEYQLSALSQDKIKVSQFSELFNNCGNDKLRLEATPDYLYSEKAARRIHDELSDSKLVFILREPVDRIKSWYKFSLQNGLIPNRLSIDDYINLNAQSDKKSPQHLRAIEHGKYGQYLLQYLQLFGESRIHVCYYEELVKNPEEFCRSIANFSGIEPDYFDSYSFRIFNQSVPVKSVKAHRIFKKMKRYSRPVSSLLPETWRKGFKLAGQKAEKYLVELNRSKEIFETRISPENLKHLKAIYQSDWELLRNLTGKTPPWQ
jgi:hypothetical protein